MTTVRRALTHSQREKALQQTRRQDEMREDTIRRLGQEKLLEANMNSEEQIEEKRFLRRLQLEQKEREMEEAIMKAERDKRVKSEQLEQEERMAKELQSRKMHELRDEKMRQQIRETSIELRELEAKLKAAYLMKERAAQMAEKEAIKYDSTNRDSEIARQMKEEHERAASAERVREREHYTAQVRYQQELERQLEEQETRKQENYQEFLKEKLMIDEIVRKIYEEDQRERERQLQKEKATIAYIKEFKAARQDWKEKEKDRMEEENRKIMEYAHVRQEREAQRMEEKKARDLSMAHVQETLSKEIAEKEGEREDMERVRMELYLEEQEEKERLREQDAVEKIFRQRIELQHNHAEQMRLKTLRREAELEEEGVFRKQMMAKFAEDDRIEQMNEQKRRMKQLEHRRAVEALLGERRAQFANDRERELAERFEDDKMEAFRKQIIEEERQKLLQEHAMKLLGYLPKGVIRDTKDLDLLGSDFKQAYSQRQIDPFDDEGWNKGGY